MHSLKTYIYGHNAAVVLYDSDDFSAVLYNTYMVFIFFFVCICIFFFFQFHVPCTYDLYGFSAVLYIHMVFILFFV